MEPAGARQRHDVLRAETAVRLLIAGVPRSGKTTLSAELESKHRCAAMHTDDLIGKLDWSEVSRHVAEDWFTRAGPWVIEGVAVPRAIRKWFRDMRRTDAPCDRLIWMPVPRLELSAGQRAMAKGCISVYDEVIKRLLETGVEVETVTP